MRCHACRSEVALASGESVGYRESCARCAADLHVCLQLRALRSECLQRVPRVERRARARPGSGESLRLFPTGIRRRQARPTNGRRRSPPSTRSSRRAEGRRAPVRARACARSARALHPGRAPCGNRQCDRVSRTAPILPRTVRALPRPIVTPSYPDGVARPSRSRLGRRLETRFVYRCAAGRFASSRSARTSATSRSIASREHPRNLCLLPRQRRLPRPGRPHRRRRPGRALHAQEARLPLSRRTPSSSASRRAGSRPGTSTSSRSTTSRC